MDTTLHTTRDALAESMAKLAAARPAVVDVLPAGAISPHHANGGVSHAGPPIAPQRMCPPMRAALGAAMTLEGIAPSPAEALALLEDDQVALRPNHELGGVGPMVGVITASMPVFVARDEATGRTAWTPINEGSGRVLRYGADGPDVLERLAWMRDVLAPALRVAIERTGPLDLMPLLTASLLQGDEAHHQTEVGTALTLEALAPGLQDADPSVATFIAGNGQFFLNLAMLHSKLALDCASGVPGSPLLTAIARNGVEVGIRVSGTGDAWFSGPAAAPSPQRLFEGWAPGDMNPDLGDSAIVEAYGLGALAVAASPAAAYHVGIEPEDVAPIQESLAAIAAGHSVDVAMPGGPAILGVDVRAVVATGIRPPVHTGIAHREPGIGQIGAGVTHPPMNAFTEAVAALDGAAS